MKKIYHLAPFLLIILSGCAALGTSTVYKAKEKIELNKIGYADIMTDSISAEDYEMTNNVFLETVPAVFREYQYNSDKYIDLKIYNSDPGDTMLKKICLEQNIDGLLIFKLKFIGRPFKMYTLQFPYNTEVETKLYDKNGKLLIHTKHNTNTGNSYFGAPSQSVTIHDGVKGALTRLIKEIKDSSINK